VFRNALMAFGIVLLTAGTALAAENVEKAPLPALYKAVRLGAFALATAGTLATLCIAFGR
jgi:hypothetical protein